jgi:hypothetical protein
MTKEQDLTNVFNKCLAQLQAGMSPDQILAQYPAEAAELRPLLETARLARSVSTDTSISYSAQARSRALFLSEAARLREKPRPFRIPLFYPLRLAGTIVIILVLLASGVFGTTLASARALPGGAFYPVKLAIEQSQLNLTGNLPDRLRLEEKFDHQRSEEVAALLQRGRAAQVTFNGFLESPARNEFLVSGLHVVPVADQVQNAQGLLGSDVEVNGKTRVEGDVIANDIHLHLVLFSGTLDSYQLTEWIIEGVPITISPATRIFGKPITGSLIHVSATRLPGGELRAVVVQVGNASQIEPNETSVPTPSPTVTSNPTVTPEPGISPTAVPTLTTVPTQPALLPTAEPDDGSESDDGASIKQPANLSSQSPQEEQHEPSDHDNEEDEGD